MVVLATLTLAAAALTPAVSLAAGERVERRLAAMGTWLELELEAPERAAALAASEAAVRAIEAVEARLSTWRSDSELARLNAAPVGVPVPLSEALASDLAQAAEWWRRTDGAFDPGLGPLVAAWGLRTGGRRPSADELERARAPGGFAGFALDGHTARRLHPGAALEEGGFGKGLGLDAAVEALRAAGIERARLDLGGQLAVLGPVTARLADPAERGRAVLELELGAGSLATSGNSEHGIVVDGVRLGHLLDPRTGEPAPDFGSLSVWAADATAADCLSTGLYVMGPEAALAWARTPRARESGIEVLVLERRGSTLRARATPGLRARLHTLVPELELELDADAQPVPESPPSLSAPPR